MKIEYVCHSSLYIDTGDTNLIFDPWFNGPAYFNQWFVFPKPVDTSMVEGIKNILITHGHEDHLHENTLNLFPKEANLFFPYQWRAGIETFFSEKGFFHVHEAVSFKSYPLSPTTKITYIGFALESVVVVECNNQVIVNLNDALNSHHQNVVDLFLIEIKKRWSKIDYLFSGWSGAGYFPNCVHYHTKNDEDIARLREQYFANHFCKIIQALQPVHALPFSPGFALLRKDKRWINDVKFPRSNLESYYREYFEKDTAVQFIIMEPGDYIENHHHHKKSPYHAGIRNNSLYHLVEEVYAAEIILADQVFMIAEEDAELLKEKITVMINENKSLYNKEVLADACFTICVSDLDNQKYFNVDFNGVNFEVHRSGSIFTKRKLILTVDSKLLFHSLDREWGGDFLTIGYGMDIEVFEEQTLEKNLDIVCVRLLARYPHAFQTMIRQPLRTAKFFLTNPLLSKLYVKQKLRMRNEVNKYPYNERDHWISYSKCDLCQVCKMPLLSFELGEQLGTVH
jgi:hypothetical protein